MLRKNNIRAYYVEMANVGQCPAWPLAGLDKEEVLAS